MFEYKRTITDQEEQLLLNDLLDIKDWIDKAIEGKINNCLKRAAKQFEEEAKQRSIELIPVKEAAKAAALLTLSGYKNRQQREDDNAKRA